MASKTNSPEEEERRRKEKQKNLDSILDAALDELDHDSDDDGDGDADEDNDGERNLPEYDVSVDSNAKISDDKTATAPFDSKSCSTGAINQIDKEAAPLLEEAEPKPKPQRPVFGPEPPPPPSSSSKKNKNLSTENKNSSNNHDRSNDDMSAEEAELAASLEGMMHDFLRATGDDIGKGGSNKKSGIPNEKDCNGMEELENVEKELEDIFRQMMIMEGSGGVGELESALGGLRGFPGSGGVKTDCNKSKTTEKATKNTAVLSSGTRTKKSVNEEGPKNEMNINSRKQNMKQKTTKNLTPTVDESINKLLDNMNNPTSSPSTPNFDPNIMPDMSNFDPSNLEQLSEEMMNSVMKDMEKLNSKQDADQMVDGVMKQLLNKDLMYEPMKQVMMRFPKWLAENKEGLSEEEYEKYGTQYQYFQRIVRVYETEPDNFPRLMELMQDIQE